MLRLDVTSLVWAFFRPGEKEDYMEVQKEDQRDPDEKVVEIEIERLRDFKNHPFKVQADSQMKCEANRTLSVLWCYMEFPKDNNIFA